MTALTLLSGPSVGDTNNNIDYASTSFTPTAGKQLWVFAHYEGPAATGALAAVGIGFPTGGMNGLTFTQVNKAVKNVSGESLFLFKADQLTPGSPASMQLSFDSTDGSAATGITWGVFETSELCTTRQCEKADNLGSGTTPAVSFSIFTLTTSVVVTAVAHGANPASMTPPTGQTTRLDVGHGSPTRGLQVAAADSGVTTATITWGSNTATAKCAIAVELEPSAPAATAPPPPDRSRRAHLPLLVR